MKWNALICTTNNNQINVECAHKFKFTMSYTLHKIFNNITINAIIGALNVRNIKIAILSIVTSRPQDFSFLYFEKKGFGIGRVWKDVSVTVISQAYTQWRVPRVERTFMAPEYGSTSGKDAITPFFESSALVGPNSSQGT